MNVLIAQARFRSSRLPGKVLCLIAGRTMLAHVVDRLERCRNADRIIIATSDHPADDVVAGEAESLGADVFRGSEQDVLGRYLAAARHAAADVVIRVCADAPLLDPAVIDSAVDLYGQQRDNVDYVSNMMHRTFPRGQSVEVMRTSVLEKLDRLAGDPHEREHVTPYLLEHTNQFRVADYRYERDLSQMNWTVDTPEDLAFVREVYDRLYRGGEVFGMIDVLTLLDADPQLASQGMIL